jgi:bifunctional DNase/RNase
MDVPVELSRIVITETSPEQVIFLREKNGTRNFPILIGIGEAVAIDRRLKGVQMPRPMTHDLLAHVIEAMGGRIERIVVNDLRDATFIATIYIRRGGEIIPIDSRPSDAIALGIAQDTPLFVAEHVLQKVLSEEVTVAQQRGRLEVRRNELADHINELREQLQDEGFTSTLSEEGFQTLQQQIQEMQADLEAIDEILRQLPE